MSIAMTALARRWRRGGLIVLLLVLICGPAPVPASAASEPPPGMARIWIYRDTNPYATLRTPYVRINGTIVGVSWIGSAFYRDVPPGVYTITADSTGWADHQFATVALVSGQSVCVRVEGTVWDQSKHWNTDIFYTEVVPPRQARIELPGVPVCTGGRALFVRNQSRASAI